MFFLIDCGVCYTQTVYWLFSRTWVNMILPLNHMSVAMDMTSEGFCENAVGVQTFFIDFLHNSLCCHWYQVVWWLPHNENCFLLVRFMVISHNNVKYYRIINKHKTLLWTLYDYTPNAATKSYISLFCVCVSTKKFQWID